MDIIILFVYFIFSYVSFKYTKKDSLPKHIDFIVLLSASTNSITNHRISHARKLAARYENAEIVACGKYKKELFRSRLTDLEDRLILQSSSTNTYEDALEAKNIVKGSKKIILVSSHSHEIRALNTFLKFFKRENILCSPSNDIFTWYSFLLPTGWVASFVNYIKDRKYNS